MPDDHPLNEKQRTEIVEKNRKVIEEMNRKISANPKQPGFYSRRGDAHFFLGEFAEAVNDYDKMVELDPELEAGNWQRGIAYFYAKQYENGAKQFDLYRSIDNLDRENGIWRYFCQVKAFGFDKAKKTLLKYKKDDREPFPSVYKLFSGKITAKEILKKIEKADVSDKEREKRYFYAYLYIGLNQALENKPEQAKNYLKKCITNQWGSKGGYGPNYMWHVGRLHYELLVK